jgi:hypothetical protein
VTPWDIENVDAFYTPDDAQRPLPKVSKKERLKLILTATDRGAALADTVRTSFTVRNPQSYFMFQHFLYESQSRYVKAYLMDGSVAGFLRADYDPQWQERLQVFDRYAGEMAMKAKLRGIPFVVALIPNRAQTAMISMGEWPDGYDPYKLGNEVRSIVTGHGGTYIDILPYFRNVPNPESHYFPIDGHPDADGHAIISDFLARGLTGGAIPGLKSAANQGAFKDGQ